MKKRYRVPEALIEFLEKEDALTTSPIRGEDTIDNPDPGDVFDEL